MERNSFPPRPDVLSEPLLTSILNVQNAIEFAHETGHGHFGLENNDTGVATTYCEGLAGCSDQSYNIILSPLQSVYNKLKSLKVDLNGWAYKAKRMHSQRGLIARIAKDGALVEADRLKEIKEILFQDVGYIDAYYVKSFGLFYEELEPLVASLEGLKNRICDIASELDITFGEDDDSGSETDSNRSISSEMSGSSNGSQDTIRPRTVQVQEDGSEAMEIDTSDADEDEPSLDTYLDSGNDWFGPLLEEPDTVDGAADDFMEDIHGAVSGRRAPRSSPDPSNAADSFSSGFSSLAPSVASLPSAAAVFTAPRLDLGPRRTTLLPPKRRHRSGLQLDPYASPVDRVYIVAMYLVTRSLKQAESLQALAAKYGELALEMAECWKSHLSRVQLIEAKLQQENQDELLAFKLAGGLEEELFAGEEPFEFFDAGKRRDPKVDSGKCGFL